MNFKEKYSQLKLNKTIGQYFVLELKKRMTSIQTGNVVVNYRTVTSFNILDLSRLIMTRDPGPSYYEHYTDRRSSPNRIEEHG